jgi:hypothetical protein
MLSTVNEIIFKHKENIKYVFYFLFFIVLFRFSIKTNVKLAFNFVNSIPSSILCKLE